ncbi:MAG: serine hydrolase [Deltaproteobacteria bacterium]|nr:serine hydrolase [Deltaproteobacteria bacterium]
MVLAVLAPLLLAAGGTGGPGLDTATLPRLLAAAGFVPPARFKALVIELTPDAPAPGGFRQRSFSWKRTALDRTDWWPASTVKLFAAIVALEEVERRNFSPAAEVTFAYPSQLVATTVEAMVRAALTPSDNVAFDRLVELAGFDRLHARLETAGFRGTVLLRGYGRRVTYAGTGHGDPRHSPRIELREGRLRTSVPARIGRRRGGCPDQGNCTTLADLAEAMRRVMLHESLPVRDGFALSAASVALIRSALEADRERGRNVANGIREAFGRDRPVRLFHKPGFANDWFSDVVFVEPVDPTRAGGKRWIVAMAGHPGRESLDAAARAVGALLARDALSPDATAQSP